MKNFLTKTKNFIARNWAMLLITLGAISYSFSSYVNEQKYKENIKALNSQVITYKLKNGQLVSSAQSLKLDKDELNLMLTQKDKELASKFSKVETVTKIEEKIKFDTIKIVYKDTIPCNFKKTGAIVKKDYSLNYISTQKGVKIANISMTDSITIVTGTKRNWWLGKETNTIDVSHTNELVKVNEIKHIDTQPKKKWYDTNVFKISVGVILGAMF